MQVPWSSAPPLEAEYAVMRWPDGSLFAGPVAVCRELPEGSFLRVCPRAEALRAALLLPVEPPRGVRR